MSQIFLEGGFFKPWSSHLFQGPFAPAASRVAVGRRSLQSSDRSRRLRPQESDASDLWEAAQQAAKGDEGDVLRGDDQGFHG